MKGIRPKGSPLRRFLPHLPALFLFAALTLWVTWPLPAVPATHLQQAGDCYLNSGLLAWVQYALLHQLGGLFQQNVFWPYADALAYGEPMLTQSLLTLPLRPFTTAPAALYNVSLMQGFFLSAAAAYALAFYYFRSRAAATLAGVVYGFALYRIQHTDHVQLIHAEGLPLMILALEWILFAGPARRRAGGWLLALAALAQWLASWYWTVFSFWVFVPYAAARLWMRRRRLGAGDGISLLAPLILAMLLIAPLTGPYLRLRAGNVMVRPAAAMINFAARPPDFLRPTHRNLLWGRAWQPDAVTGANSERTLFPGLLPAAALAAGLSIAFRRRRRPQSLAADRFPLRLWCFLTLLLLSFCFGSHVRLGSLHVPTPYAVLGRVIPLNDQIRVAARWLLPAMLGFALLAGWAWQRWFAGRAGPRRVFGIALALLLIAEHLTRPMTTTPVPGRPDAFESWLDRQPYPSPTLLLPASFDTLMIHAAMHRQPLVNGSNGYFPPLYNLRMREVERFPDADVVAALRAMQVRYVAIDMRSRYAAARGDWPALLDTARRNPPNEIGPAQIVGDRLVVELAAPPANVLPTVPNLGAAVLSTKP
jgi:hypothetical protein